MGGLGGPLERAIMNALWEVPDGLRIRELLVKVNEGADRPLAYNTVQTVAERLSRKGLLRRVPDGQAFRYLPTRTRDEHAVELMLDALTESSDHAAMLARFAESVDAQDARHLFDALRERAIDEPGT